MHALELIITGIFLGLGRFSRLIPSKILSFEQLDLSRTASKILPNGVLGIILVTGPTGSGKSTTLAAIIDYINATYAQKIITIEEPVEFTHPNKQSLISHREVGKDTESFYQRASYRDQK